MPTPRKTIAKLGATWMDDNDIRHALAKIHHNRNQHDSTLRGMKQKLAIHEHGVQKSLDGVGVPNAKSIINKSVSGRRHEMIRESADIRKAYIRELSGVAERIKSASAHYKSPMQMLMRSTLGSEQRSRYLQQIEHSGPVELASMAEYAAAKQDSNLAAALCSKVSGMKTADRPFGPNDLADVMCGELHRELSQALVECERQVLEALQADTEFETGKANPQRSIEIALLKKREQNIGAYTKDDDETDDNAEAA